VSSENVGVRATTIPFDPAAAFDFLTLPDSYALPQVAFFEATTLPLPSFELREPVVLIVPGAGTTITGAVVEVDDVISEEVVCARAPPATRIKAHVLAAKHIFIVILHQLPWNNSDTMSYRQRRHVFQVKRWEISTRCDRSGNYACRMIYLFGRMAFCGLKRFRMCDSLNKLGT
jgi:hypothetical protein